MDFLGLLNFFQCICDYLIILCLFFLHEARSLSLSIHIYTHMHTVCGHVNIVFLKA